MLERQAAADPPAEPAGQPPGPLRRDGPVLAASSGDHQGHGADGRARRAALGRELNALERSRLAQTINLVARQSKSGISDPDQLLDLWEDRIVAELGLRSSPAAERLALAVEAGATARTPQFSPTAVAAEAIQAVAESRAAWSRADLMLEVERRLPLMGLSTGQKVELIRRVTDHALRTDGLVQVARNVTVVPPADLVAPHPRPLPLTLS